MQSEGTQLSKMFCRVAMLLFIATLSSARKIKFTDCGEGNIDWVDVEPCAEEPCMFKKGTSVTLIAAATAKHSSAGGNLRVTVELGGIEVDYPGVETDVCKIVTCPIQANKPYQLKYDIIAEDYFPDLVTDMKWDVTGDNGKKLLCASARVGIQT